MSSAAAKRLHRLRVRRLLEIELDDLVSLDAGSAGPLGGDIIRVWIDLPEPGRAIVEVRRTGRALKRRTLAIGKYSADVAAATIAMVASEMVRYQARLLHRKTPPVPEPVDAPERKGELHARQGLAISASTGALWLPESTPGAVLGPELALEHRSGLVGQQLYGRWLVGDDGARWLGWLEVGAGASVRLPLPAAGWRMHLGARAGAVALQIPQAAAINEVPSTPQSWTVRAGGLVGLEARLAPRTWLGLAVEPGAALRSLRASDAAGETWEVGGFAMNVALGLTADPPAAW